MPAPSFFRRITRYSVSASQDQHENRLTEITAAVLSQVEGFPAAVLSELLEQASLLSPPAIGSSDSPTTSALSAWSNRPKKLRVDIATQVATPSGRWVDLQLRFRSRHSADFDFLVWVEVKHGAGLHGDQVDRYLEDIEIVSAGMAAQQTAVLILEPRSHPVEGAPPRALRAHWETVGRVVRKWLQRGDLDAVSRYLLAEYAKYLWEEGLMDPEGLTATHALALLEADNAEAAIAAVCEHADHYVAQHWGSPTAFASPRGSSTEPLWGPDYWANFSMTKGKSATDRPDDRAHFVWGLRGTLEMDYLEDPRGAHAFLAGIEFPAGDPAKVPALAAWLGRANSLSFSRLWDGNYAVVRMLYPDQLLSERTSEKQGRLLGEWIVQAFTVLAADPPFGEDGAA